MPEESQTELQKLIDELSQKLSDIGQAKKNLDGMIEKLEVSQACVTDAALNPSVTSVPAAAALVDFHLNKTAGSYGSYGISTQLSRINSMKEAMTQEETFYELAIAVYNLLDKGLPIPSDLEFPPGYDQNAGALYNKDMDHPLSRNRLESGADLHMQNRPYDATINESLKYVLPTSSQVGDMVCLAGVQYIYTEDGAYYPVGIQEPDDVCNVYGIHHPPCETGGGT